MDLNTLSNSIEKQVVNHVHGWGVSITYTIRKTNTTIPSVNAFAQNGSFIKLNEKDQVFEDSMSFLSVFLDTRPVKGDTIVYEGVNWNVEMLEGVNPYDIVCSTGARHSSSRSGRRER